MNNIFAHKKQDWIFLIFLAVLLVITRLPALDEPLDNDSGSVAFLARQILRGGILYGEFHPTHHLPGIYYTFVAAFKIFGDHPYAPKLFLLLWSFACAWLIFYFGRLFLNDLTGKLGAVFFILVSSQVALKGTTVEMEHFANLPLTAGTFLAIVLLQKKAPAWQFLSVGAIGAMAVLFKIIFIAPLAVAGISILVLAFLDRGQADMIKRTVSYLIWLLVGFAIPVLIVGTYFASVGLWNRLLLVFNIGSGYMRGGGMYDWLPPPFGFPLLWMSVSNATLLIFGLMGTYRIARRAVPIRDTNYLTELMLVFWLVVSFAEAGLRRGGWEHYALLVVPPLAVMGAHEISVAYDRWKTIKAGRQAVMAVTLMSAFVILNFGIMNYAFYSHYISYRLGNISRQEFISGYPGTSGTGPAALNAEIIGGYLNTHTTSDDLIYLATNNVQSYYYADRKPPVEIVWPDYLFLVGNPEKIFDSRTKYIVLDKPENLDRPQWLMDGLKRDYSLETVIGGQEIYRRNSP